MVSPGGSGEAPAESSAPTADVAGSPPRPARPSYAALAAQGSGTAPAKEAPPRPARPDASGALPIAVSDFFDSKAIPSSASSPPLARHFAAVSPPVHGPRPPTSPSTSFRAAGSYSQALAGAKPVQDTPTEPSPTSADQPPSSDDDELRIAGNEGYRGPGASSPTSERKPVQRTYGKAKRSSPSFRGTPPQTNAVAGWDEDAWADSPAVRAPVVRSTSAVRQERNDVAPPGAWGSSSWEQAVETHYADQHANDQTAGQRAPKEQGHRPLSQTGWWSTPRVLAKSGENGSLPGTWPATSYDFKLFDTPVGQKAVSSREYPPMGSVLSPAEKATPTSPGGTDSAMQTDSSTPVVPTGQLIEADHDSIEDADEPVASKPKRAPRFRTVTREELDASRPHQSLYFCPETFAWALWAKTRDGQPVPPGEAALWYPKFDFIMKECMGNYLGALFKDDPIPVPLAPARGAPGRPARPTMEDLSLSDVAELNSTYSRQLFVSTQDWYPTVIPSALFHAFIEDRGQNPATGRSSFQTQYLAVKTLWRFLDNHLFVGEFRGLPIHGKTFHGMVGWDGLSQEILLGVLGAEIVSEHNLQFPNYDFDTEEGKTLRARLLRCWLELGLWLEHAHKVNPGGAPKLNTRIELQNAREKRLAAMGGETLPLVPPTESWKVAGSKKAQASDGDPSLDPLVTDYDALGATPDLADEVIVHLYDTLTEKEPWSIPHRLDAFVRITEARSSEPLRIKVAQEQSLERLTASEIRAAHAELRLPDPFDPHVYHPSEEERVELLQKRLAEVEHPGRRALLLQAAKTVAAHMPSDYFKAVLESATAGETDETEKPKMDLDAACRVLGIEKDTDDEFTILTYGIRLEDATDEAQKVKIKDALTIIADARNSDVLRTHLGSEGRSQFDEAGWQAAVAIDPRIPVGLTNIANTCYLNSLLQYFFTIREMRETILAFEDRATPEAGSRQNPIRVGPREVSPAEIKRAKRFVVLLKTLFEQLIHAPVSAVTPETELAYLALVPSREEAEAASAEPVLAGPSSAEPDAMKTDSPAPAVSAPPPVASPAESSEMVKSPSSVLGKRKNDDEEDEVMQTELQSPTLSRSNQVLGERDMNRPTGSVVAADDSAQTPSDGAEDDAERPRIKRGRSLEKREQDPQPSQQAPPPLPPRPALPAPDTKRQELERQVSSYMSFGRQNDVTECMDNVIFQVEAALLANSSDGEGQESAHLLRRIFYGTMRQQIAFDDPMTVDDPLRTQDEPFSALFVDIPAESGAKAPGLTRDIYDALDTLFEPSVVELESHSARRHIRLVSPPPTVLQVQLQRVQFDVKRQSTYKSNAHLALEDEIDVGRYLETQGQDVEEAERRRRTDEANEELRKVRSRLSELTSDRTSNAAKLLRSAQDFGKTLTASLLARIQQVGEPAQDAAVEDEPMADVEAKSPTAKLKSLFIDSLFEDTEQEAKDLEEEIDSLNRRVGELKRQMRELWDGGGLERQSRYKLTAVFIHRGTANSGHYYIYQRDLRDEKRWLKYNDSLVTEVDADEVFRETTGDTNPYFLSYARMDRLDAIEAIKREPV